jgi:hypothetical protein
MDFEALLAHPNETLSVEYKSWLNFQENADRAKLAKAAIALANYGGGLIVLGMRPDNAEGGSLESRPRPSELRRYSQDEVNAAVHRFSDPAFHCELLFGVHPKTRVEHALVVVPADITVPVMTTRDCDGVCKKWRCYTRKPGPRSEEPQSAEEWRMLLDKCVRARRDEMLDSIRVIVQGHTGTLPTRGAIDQLIEFSNDARKRWESLVQPFDKGDVARLPFGRYELAFDVIGARPLASLSALRSALEQAGRIRHTGWGPFIELSRQPYVAKPFNGVIETWLGAPDPAGDRSLRDSAHCDFWAAHPAGKLFLLRGYDEDATESVEPGTIFDFTLPIWRVAEALLFVARFGALLEEAPLIAVRCHYFGLKGRALGRTGRHGSDFRQGRICDDCEAVLETQVSTKQIESTLAEVVHPLLVPLYERFNFYQLPFELVLQETSKLRSNRF